jgi:hypothetical protein
MVFRLRYLIGVLAAAVLVAVLAFDRYVASAPHFYGRCPQGSVVGLTFHDGYLGYLVCGFHAISPLTGAHQRIGYVLLRDNAGPREHFFYDRERYLYYRSKWGRIYRVDLGSGDAVKEFTVPVREVSSFCVASMTPVFRGRWLPSEILVLDRGEARRLADFGNSDAKILNCGAGRVVVDLFSNIGTTAVASVSLRDGSFAELLRPKAGEVVYPEAADAATGELFIGRAREPLEYLAPGHPPRQLPALRASQFSLGRKYIYRMDGHDLTIIDKATLQPVRVLHTGLFLNAIYEYLPGTGR